MDYTAMATTATNLLAQHGWNVTLRNVVPGTGNPDGTVTGGAPVEVTRKGFVFDFNAGQTKGPGGLVQAGDRECILEVGTTPALEDLIIDEDGTVWLAGIPRRAEWERLQRRLAELSTSVVTSEDASL